MSRTPSKGPNELQEYVISKKLCSACGACTNLCPYIDMVKGKGAVIIEPCGLSEGKCYDICPKTRVDLPTLDKLIYGSPRKDVALGSNISVMKARAVDSEIREAAQYGGVVSALLTYALEIGEINAAVLAKSQDRIGAEPVLAKSRKEVLECVGSRYLACPTVSKVWEAIEQEKSKIGVVGTPCQITAIRKMLTSNSKTKTDNIGFLIGLFCTWALSPDVYSLIRRTVGQAKVVKADVPPPPANIFVVQTEDKVYEIPLDEMRRYIMPACNACFDMTNEFSDISVGAVEGEKKWNTVIVRSRAGEELFQAAKNAGILVVKPLEYERLNHLREASLKRKRRVLTDKETDKVAYLITSDEDKSRIIHEIGDS